METTVDARKTRMGEDEAWDLLKDADSIVIAKGKKIVSFDKATMTRDEVLNHAMGPSGNLRAPTFKNNDRYLIGFHEDAYTDWFKC